MKPQYSRAPARGLGAERRKPGFTLIELLVVIAVIAILAALLLPALSRARIAADNTVCRNNLRQYAVALGMYVNDFGYYPPLRFTETNHPPSSLSDYSYWHVRLEPYTKTKWIEWIPACPPYPQGINAELPRPKTIQDCPSYARLPGAREPGASAYGYNSDGFAALTGPQSLGLSGNEDYWGPADPNAFLPATQVLCPSDMVAVGDACLVDVSGYFAYSPYSIYPYNGTDDTLGLNAVFSGPYSVANAKWLARRHAGRWNFAFCDGHTENRRIREMFDPRQPDQVKRWNNDHQPHLELLKQLYPGLH